MEGEIQSHQPKKPEREQQKRELDGGINMPVTEPTVSSSTIRFASRTFQSKNVKQECGNNPVKQDGDKTQLPVLPPEIVRIVFEQAAGSIPAKFLRGCVLVNKTCARAFISGLLSVRYYDIIDDAESCPAFLDAAHPHLRQITFPVAVPPILEQRFFEECSDALLVLCMGGPELSPSSASILGTRCTGLKAFKYCNSLSMDLDGFELLMQLRGPQLVALKIAEDCLTYSEPKLLRSIAKHCRSLEFFSLTSTLEDEVPATEDEILDLLRLSGRTLRHLSLLLIKDHIRCREREWDLIREDLLETIADCCPNLRTLILNLPVGSRSDSRTYRLDAVGKLLDKCRYLQELCVFDVKELRSDPDLKAKVDLVSTNFPILS
ncbi:hypothetical protein HK102_002307 [Quaeritorhiza haematococci]|nr:hypothetical protein HK102_002307 [Quaeritorhiza haematococci]